jgi:hypothetical protein
MLSNRSPPLQTRVSANKFPIWKIRDWRLGAEIGRLALDECYFAVVETDTHSDKSPKCRTFS